VVSRIVPSKVDGASCRATQPARRPGGAGRGCRRAPRLLRRIQPAKLLEVAAPPPLVVGSSTLVSGPELVIWVCHHRIWLGKALGGTRWATGTWSPALCTSWHLKAKGEREPLEQKGKPMGGCGLLDGG
jgi:hypothetical protein